MSDPNRLVPATEARLFLGGISERHLWGKTSPRGDIACIRLGRRVLYPGKVSYYQPWNCCHHIAPFSSAVMQKLMPDLDWGFMTSDAHTVAIGIDGGEIEFVGDILNFQRLSAEESLEYVKKEPWAVCFSPGEIYDLSAIEERREFSHVRRLMEEAPWFQYDAPDCGIAEAGARNAAERARTTIPCQEGDKQAKGTSSLDDRPTNFLLAGTPPETPTTTLAPCEAPPACTSPVHVVAA